MMRPRRAVFARFRGNPLTGLQRQRACHVLAGGRQRELRQVAALFIARDHMGARAGRENVVHQAAAIRMNGAFLPISDNPAIVTGASSGGR